MYNTVSGKEAGSTYFNFIELGELFEKEGFGISDGNIENVQDPFNGWRLPTNNERIAIMGTTRTGSIVNGIANVHWVAIGLTGVPNVSFGLLLFPDGENVTGKELSGYDKDEELEGDNSGVTIAELMSYLEQGCVFLPATGRYYVIDEYEFYWDHYPDHGYYWTSTNGDIQIYFAHCFSFDYTHIYSDSTDGKEDCYYPVRLVKSAN